MLDASLSPRPPWAGRRIVLGVTGGIAAYKAIQLARDLTRLGALVDTVLTPAAEAFVGALSFAGVTGREARTELLSVEGKALHVELGQTADAVVVAPATADFLARAAQGRANDLLTAVLLSTRAPVILAPAMNDRMFSHVQTRKNLEYCRDVLGYRVVGPVRGALAAGEGEGEGRMTEPDEIREHVGRVVGPDPAYDGRTVVVNAGPTREAIDSVRFLGNRSSGRMGYALAREAWLRGADVTLVSGPAAVPPPVGVTTVFVETAEQMLEAMREAASKAGLLVFSAAVADFRVRNPFPTKIRRTNGEAPPTLELVANPDIILETRKVHEGKAVTVGFALEVEDLAARAIEKMKTKELDLIVANDPAEEGAGFDVSTNRATLFFPTGEEESLPLQSKEDLAREILDRVRPALRQG